MKIISNVFWTRTLPRHADTSKSTCKPDKLQSMVTVLTIFLAVTVLVFRARPALSKTFHGSCFNCSGWEHVRFVLRIRTKRQRLGMFGSVSSALQIALYYGPVNQSLMMVQFSVCNFASKNLFHNYISKTKVTITKLTVTLTHRHRKLYHSAVPTNRQ